MPDLLDEFLAEECSDELAGQLRTEIAIANGSGWDKFYSGMFDLELFYGEHRVVISDILSDQPRVQEIPMADFLRALPDVAPGARMPGRPLQATPMPPGPADPRARRTQSDG